MTKRKKTAAAVIAAVGVLLLAWAGVFLTDFVCVSKATEPIFAKPISDGTNTVYKGPGYTVETEYSGISLEQITMYSAFGTVINAVILCY